MAELAGLGRFEGAIHILPIRIYYEDTDVSGVVYHANYLRYMERGRCEFFRCAGVARIFMPDGDEATAWTLRRVALEYLKPARVDDEIEVHTAATALSGARMMAAQKIFSGGRLMTRGSVEACIMTLTGKPRRIPEHIRAKLAPLLFETIA